MVEGGGKKSAGCVIGSARIRGNIFFLLLVCPLKRERLLIVYPIFLLSFSFNFFSTSTGHS